MKDHSELWKQWTLKLSQWQLRKFATTLIESSGAFHPIIAQFVLLGQPMFGQTTRMHLDAIVELLEEPQMCQAFVEVLSQEPTEC
jgi:hypothetical protein